MCRGSLSAPPSRNNPSVAGFFCPALSTATRRGDTSGMYTAALERTEREVAELCRGGLDKDAFCRSVGERLARVLQFDGSCWHTIDPATLLITSHLTENIPDVELPAPGLERVRRG